MEIASTLVSVPTGKIKSFGSFGPKYEVGSPVKQLEDGDWLIQITLVDSGELAEYRLSHLLDDPDGQ